MLLVITATEADIRIAGEVHILHAQLLYDLSFFSVEFFIYPVTYLSFSSRSAQDAF